MKQGKQIQTSRFHIARKNTLLVALLVCLGCSRAKTEPATKVEDKLAGSAEHKDEPEHEGLSKKVKLSDKVIASAKINMMPVAKEVLAITLALPGEVSVDPDKNARVSSPVPGRISQVHFKEGSNVKKGALLATVRVPDIAKVRAGYAAASAKAASARTNATRLQELSQKGLASNQETLNAQSEAGAIEAEAKALAEQLRSLGMGAAGEGSELSLRAPIAGIVVSREAVVGQPVTTEETIANIADLSEVWFLSRVFEKDLDSIHMGVNAEVELNAFPKRRFTGTVEYVGRQIDPIARTVTARIRLTNQDDVLRLGLFGVAHVVVGTEASEPVLVVPRSAVVEISGKPVVFVRHTDGDFELHEVLLGQSNLGKVQVISGLREGENVVVEGAFTLKSAVLRGSLAEED
ncbi:MAG: efflux RND transporter periplasmic adaptor subunit [Polyangiaceae bacterium]|nr:efflux RND transporter periplasmic adaptor subunit [Polyangiaceae bacterium]